MTRKQICTALGVVAPAMAAIAVGFAILSGCLLSGTGGQTAQAQGGTGGDPNIIGIDVKIDDDGDTTPDNTQSTLGTIDTCIAVATNDIFQVDVFLDDVPTGQDFQSQDYFVNFDNTKLTGLSQDHSGTLVLLGKVAGSSLFDVSSIGASYFHSAVIDMAVPAATYAEQPGELGVLGRYEFQATGSGIAALNLSDTDIILGNSPAVDWFATDIDQVWDANFSAYYGLIAVDVPCPLPADLKKVSMSVVDPPTEINVSEDLSFQLQEVLHNNGPADPVAATSSTWATPPEGGEVSYHCQGGEVITINDQEVDGDCAPTTVYTVGYPDVLDVHINVNLPPSIDEVLLTDWDIHCLEPSTHTWQFHNELYAEDPYTGDPDPENNSRDLDLTLDCLAEADLKVVDTNVSSAPAPMDPFSVPTIIIGEQASLQVDSLFHNNGPYGPVYADIESISTAATYVGGDSTQWGAWGNVGCTVTPDLPIVQAELPVFEDHPLAQDYSIICDMGGIGYDDDGDTLVDEDPIGGPSHDYDHDGLIDEDACNSIDDDGDTLTDEDPPNGDEDCDGAIDEDSPFYLATVYLETQIQPKDPHVVDFDPANDQDQAVLNLAVVRPFTPSFSLTIDEAFPDDHMVAPVDDDCIVGLPCKSLSELSFPNDPPTGGPPAGQPLGSWLEVIGSASGGWSHASGLNVPNGEEVGQADLFFNVTLIPGQACNVAVGGTWELYDACLPPPGHPYIPAPYLEEPGCLVDQPTQPDALAVPSAYTSWSHSLDSIVRDIYTRVPTAYLWARYSSALHPALTFPINVLVFDLSGGAGTGPWLRAVVVGDPAQPYSFPYICSPAVGHLLILGQTPTTAVPVLTCNQASPPSGVASAPQIRQDIDTVVTLIDNVTCTAAETDVSVSLAKDENVGDGAPMSESGACDDDLDNDADGYIDLADADCDTLGASLPKEYPVTIEITNGMGPDEVDVDLTIVSHDPCQADWVPEVGDTSSSNRDGDTYTSSLQWRESILGASEVRQAVRYYSLNCSEPGTFSGPQAIQVTAVVSTVSVPDPNPANDEATNQIASIIAVADIDGDTIPNADDLCPLDPEDLDGVQDEDGCPETDADNDGILDEDDACPEDPEDLDGIQDEDGCPDIDVDGDGMPDDYEQANACLDLWVDDSAEDPDGDELANIDEMGAGTDPCDDDSDDDTFPDSQEVSLGSDPVNEDSTPEHISLPVTCTDGVDNDLDVLVDGYDLGCDIDDDGIPNAFDACIALAEDMDGFEDADGCPDADNDMDGVCDPWVAPSPACEGSDGCPNVAEDIDDFWDEDGCPDPDNDGDGFPDWTDDCPATDWTAGTDRDPATLYDNPLDELGVPIDTREDYDGVIDWDGCHDSPGDDYDGDGMSDEMEVTAGSDPTDMDTDDDGLCDGSNPPLCGSEDLNNNGVVDPGETDPLNPDTDGDGLSDGLESGLAVPETPDTDTSSTNWQPDTDPASTTNPLNPDSDGDGLTDGSEDVDHDGRVDTGETDPDNSDTDADGFDDGGDNCPAIDNPGQEDFESDGIGDVCDDSDGDLSTDALEFFVGTDPLDDCPDNDTDDVWPFDTDMNTSINVLDLFSFVLAEVLGTTSGEPNYSARFDLNANESINVLDLFEYVRLEVLGTQCTNP